jgi:hypothetical protein
MRSAKEATMGRPTTSEPRNKQLNLSLTSNEFESVRLRAKSVGMRPVHFGRAILLDERRKVAEKCDADNNVRKLIYVQLIRIGNNLNQLVRHLHRHGGALPSELDPLLRDIRRLIMKGVSQ